VVSRRRGVEEANSALIRRVSRIRISLEEEGGGAAAMLEVCFFKFNEEGLGAMTINTYFLQMR
jgi:hypothetical protein